MLKQFTCPATVQLDSEQPVARGQLIPGSHEPVEPEKAARLAQPLPPIPMSPGRQWSEFRRRFVPVLVFLVVLATACLLWLLYIVPPNLDH
jgi:hypothetical protein